MWNKIRTTAMVATLLAGTAAIAYAQSSSTIGAGGSTAGGGSTTEASGPDMPRVRAAVTSGGGAITFDVIAARTTRLCAVSTTACFCC